MDEKVEVANQHSLHLVVDDGIVNKGQVHEMSAEDRATALKLAMEADPGIPMMSWRMVQFVLMTITVCVCGGDSGFDATVMSSVNSMKQFQSYFHIVAATSTSLVFVSVSVVLKLRDISWLTSKGVFTIGAVTSALGAMYIPDKVGRRWGMFFGNAFLM
jgi:hypothetical protein